MNKIKYVVLYCILIIVPMLFFIICHNKTIRCMNIEDYLLCENLQYEIETIEVKNNQIEIEGWLIYKGDSQVNDKCNKSIWLISDSTEKKIIVATKAKERTDVSIYINDGVNYNNSGFYSCFNADELQKYGQSFSVYLCYTYHGINHLVNTQEKVYVDVYE